jgi:lipid-A-disaccharide synthase
MSFKVGIVVGEASGDKLATGLVRALKEYYPNIELVGILGPSLLSLGLAKESLFPMERLSVMGFVDPLLRLPELIGMRYKLLSYFSENPPEVFIGVDAPAFNLGIERKLKERGIKTVHYVSPTIWAWRANRIHDIKKSVDLMLSIFPFEKALYTAHAVPVAFVGHPFADEIPLEIDTYAAKMSLGLEPTSSVIAVLPGSRGGELKRLSEPYLLACKRCYQKRGSLQFVAGLVNEQQRAYFQRMKEAIIPEIPFKILLGQARTVMAACDAALVTSGTATLEVMLHKKPMVVGYKTNRLTYEIAKRLVKVPYIAQPNILANELLVPEYIQERVKPYFLAEALLKQLNSSASKDNMLKRFQEIHLSLRQNASMMAAKAINGLLENPR